MRDLRVTPPPTGPGDTIDQDEQWAIVRRMLHDPAVASIEDRAAACLVLLYSQPVIKVVALTTDDICSPASEPTTTNIPSP